VELASDGSTAINGRSEKAHAVERVKSTLLNELTPGSYGKSNSLVIEVILLRTLDRHIH